MAVIIDIHQTKEYVLKSERDKENPTIFVIGVLDGTTNARIQDCSTKYKMGLDADPGAEAEMVFNLNQARVLYAKAGIKGIKNLVDSKGHSVEFEISVIEKLPSSILYEVGDEIKKFNNFSEDERKN